MIDPCLPAGFRECRILRTFRDTVYDIVIVNKKNAKKGIRRLVVDGKEIEGNIVPAGDADRVEVIEEM